MTRFPAAAEIRSATATFWSFEIWSFEFVSDFVLRISDFS